MILTCVPKYLNVNILYVIRGLEVPVVKRPKTVAWFFRSCWLLALKISYCFVSNLQTVTYTKEHVVGAEVGSSYLAGWERRSPYSRLKEDAIDGKNDKLSMTKVKLWTIYCSSSVPPPT